MRAPNGVVQRRCAFNDPRVAPVAVRVAHRRVARRHPRGQAELNRSVRKHGQIDNIALESCFKICTERRKRPIRDSNVDPSLRWHVSYVLRKNVALHARVHISQNKKRKVAPLPCFVQAWKRFDLAQLQHCTWHALVVSLALGQPAIFRQFPLKTTFNSAAANTEPSKPTMEALVSTGNV